MRTTVILLTCLLSAATVRAEGEITGHVTDPQGRVVNDATVRLKTARGTMVSEAWTDTDGLYRLNVPGSGSFVVVAERDGFVAVEEAYTGQSLDLHFTQIAEQHNAIVVSDRVLEPSIDLRNSEVFSKTLFTRDDQMLMQLNAGINAGQHEGGGKSLEIRRFGFNLDHGGVNGGLKVMLDDVQQNQGSQGHGQGYLGSLKALSPELIGEVKLINGPFSAEYGDFSGLGVVQIRQRESLPDQMTIRLQGGNFNTGRTFLAYSPEVQRVDAYVAYEGAYTDGPFINAGRYRRDNVNANYTRTLKASQKWGVRFIFGRNNFYSSGQIPLDLVANGTLDRYGYIDPSNGGRVKLGTLSTNYTKTFAAGDTLRADAFLGRSLFDLYSNFTFFLNDPLNGDGIQQHDSRLQEGANTQYSHQQKLGTVTGVLTAGANYHDNQINVGLYPLAFSGNSDRVPLGVATRANARVTNGAGYVQENLSFFGYHVIVGGGLRFDEFRWNVRDQIDSVQSGTQTAGRWQPKASLAYTPTHAIPLTLHVNYGRGINSSDARGVIQRPESPRLANTDFYQVGTSSSIGRVSVSTDAFLIDHSNETVYIPDDGTFEFKGPSRAYGFETKGSVELNHHVSVNGGLTKISNAFFRGGEQRIYVDSSPHFVANAGLTLSNWRGWSGSLRMRAVNHYRLSGDDPSIVASGLTVFDMGLVKQLRRSVDLNLSLDNLTNRDYFETQNYLESRITPGAPVVARIHGTTGYPFTAVAGVTFHLRSK